MAESNIKAGSTASSDDFGLEDNDTSILDWAVPIVEQRWMILLGALLIGVVTLGVSFLIAPTFTSRTSLLPPQQQQSSALSALASAGALGGLSGAASAFKSPAEQYVALLQSVTVADRLIERFNLLDVYEEKLKADARNALRRNSRISIGKKDGLITVEVDDENPTRAADIANAYVDELRHLSANLALSEAQQRRTFFEAQLKEARNRMMEAQQALQASGFNAGALRAEPKAAAETYATLRAELSAAEVKLQTLGQGLSANAPEMQQQRARIGALRAQLERIEQNAGTANGTDYISRYREFKYQETLFDIFAKQYESARLDEAREGALIQVVDRAVPAERRSKPKRASLAIGATILGVALLAALVVMRQSWRDAAASPGTAAKISRLQRAAGRSN